MIDFSFLFLVSSLLLIASSFIGGTGLNIYRLIQAIRGIEVGKRIRNILRWSLVIMTMTYLVVYGHVIQGPDYRTPLTDMETPYFHEPISSEYGGWFSLLLCAGILSLFVIRKKYKTLPPLVTVILFSFVFIQITCIVVYGIQLSEHAARKPVQFSYLFLANFLIYEIQVLITAVRTFPVEKYRSIAFSLPNRLLYNSRNWSWMAYLLMFPILAVCMLLLCLFGQQPDDIVKAFTETSDWLFSQQVAPPKLPHEGHYLCTVSVQGHRKLVKPLRWGIREGTRIWVNRQLLVANAFEQILEERIPRTHKTIRYLYDRYGYPIAKHINTPLSADIVYILMKPFEYCFLLVIYLFDTHPENKIAQQYLPRDRGTKAKDSVNRFS